MKQLFEILRKIYEKQTLKIERAKNHELTSILNSSREMEVSILIHLYLLYPDQQTNG